jgi:hypothetical protein
LHYLINVLRQRHHRPPQRIKDNLFNKCIELSEIKVRFLGGANFFSRFKIEILKFEGTLCKKKASQGDHAFLTRISLSRVLV